MSRQKDPKQFGYRAGGSNRRGETRDLHRRTGTRAVVVRHSCDLCPNGETWNVAHGMSVLDAMAAHRATHSLALREAVEAVVRGIADGSIEVRPRWPVGR